MQPMQENEPQKLPHEGLASDIHDWLAPAVRVFSTATLARYSGFVTTLKLFLPIIAAIVLLVLVIIPNAQKGPPEPKKAGAVDATMMAPVYHNHDKQNQPYTVIGDAAKQHPDTPGVTDMVNPKAAIDLNNGKTLNGNADTAHYNQNNGMLDVEGHVVLKRSDGTTFTTQKASIDVNKHNASSDQPVVLQGDFGEVRGQGFQAQDGGKVIIFEGASSAKLHVGGNKSAPSLKNAPNPALNGAVRDPGSPAATSAQQKP